MRPARVAVSLLVLAVCAALASSIAMAANVTVFAAASLKEAMDEQAKQFEAKTGDKVIVSYAGSNVLAKQIDSANAQELDRRLLAVSNEMSRLNPDRNAVASAASAAAPLAQRIAERLATMPYDQTVALRMLQRISDDAENIALADERAAEQAAMAMDSLYIAYSRDAKPANAAEVRTAINELFQQLENPSAYNADQFDSSLRRIHTLLH